MAIKAIAMAITIIATAVMAIATAIAMARVVRHDLRTPYQSHRRECRIDPIDPNRSEKIQIDLN